MITFDLHQMNPVQLAKLYKLLLSLYRIDDAKLVYEAAIINCGAMDFCEEVSKA
jgi:hypothetical protein